ncbi:MAG: DNA repair protein RecO C-terminal domain-containing protein [Treponema sp.]|jgi:DNA repair protein RecO (recombination protein O)|nr:DNA repair protein RecO C-terminal domain-containing protein [Treponema sp.]
MPRNFTRKALILRTRPSGESNREVWFLCAEEGILRATVFGGPRSRLRSHAAPYHSGTAWIYHDPVKDSRKLGDFDVGFWRPGIREQYERTMTAGAVAETILASHGGGGIWEAALGLADAVFDALDGADGALCEKIFIYFLWRWADILGARPDLNRCVSCGREAGTGRGAAPAERLFFSAGEGGFLCGDCAGGQPLPAAGPGCRSWLAAAEALPPSRLGSCSADEISSREALALVRAVAGEALGRIPSTWDWQAEKFRTPPDFT